MNYESGNSQQITTQISELLKLLGTGNSKLSLESFGFFLDDYVIEGGVASVSDNNRHRIDITEMIVSFDDALYRVKEDVFYANARNATYFLDFTTRGLVFNLFHPSATYLPLWQVNTDATGGIVSLVDMRGPMGFVRFRSEIQGVIADNIIVDESHIAANSVSTSKMVDLSVTTPKISNGAVTNEKLANESVTEGKLKGPISEAKLALDYPTSGLNSRLLTAEQEIIDQDTRIDNIVASGGDSNIEIVDARYDSVNEVTYTTLRDRLDENAVMTSVGSQWFSTESRKMLHSRLSEINQKNGKVTFVGDSITELGWFKPLQSLFPKTTFVNKGIGGNGTVDVINRLSDITSTNADLYVLAIGTNDVRYQDPAKGATTPEGFATNVETILNALGKTKSVVISPFPAFDKDTGYNVLGYYTRDNTMYQYLEAEKRKCWALNVPFIEVTKEIKSLLDFSNKQYFLIDSIHPNQTTGIQLYANEILFGNQTTERWGYTKTKAQGNYVYKLEILTALGANQIDLRYLEIVSKTGFGPLEKWSTATNAGTDDINAMITGTPVYHFKNKANDFPVTITFSTGTPLAYFNQIAHSVTGSIGAFRLYESQDPYSILDFTHPSWKLINESDGNRVSFIKQLYAWDKTPKYFVKVEVVTTQAHGAARVSKILGSRAIDGYVNSANTDMSFPSVINGIDDVSFALNEGDSFVLGVPANDYNSNMSVTTLSANDLITAYRVYVTSDELANVDKSAAKWTLVTYVNNNAGYVISIPISSIRGNAAITYGSNMTDRGTSNCAKSGGVVHLSLSVKKSSAWAGNDVLAVLPTGFRPQKTLVVNGVSHGDTTGPCTLVPILVDTNGDVKVWGRNTNASNDDSISLNITFVSA